MTKKKEQGKEKNHLNKDECDDSLRINRGVELLLRNRRRELPKTFQAKFGKMVSLFRKEFHFFLDIQFDIRKKED